MLYVLKRVLAVIPVLGIVAVIVFLLLHLSPGDPAALIDRKNASDVGSSGETTATSHGNHRSHRHSSGEPVTTTTTSAEGATSVADRNTSAIIRNTATMEITLTTVKSWSVQEIRSLVQGASPISIPP